MRKETQVCTIFPERKHTNECFLVEFIVSAPVCWKPTAITIMSKAVEDAARSVKLGTDGMSPCDLFVCHEAELQSMHVLSLHASYTLKVCLDIVLEQTPIRTLSKGRRHFHSRRLRRWYRRSGHVSYLTDNSITLGNTDPGGRRYVYSVTITVVMLLTNSKAPCSAPTCSTKLS